MDMIERYVNAVAERLHPSRRGKVEAELRAAILDALEARGGSAAREEDVVAVLAELGEPDRMAAQYEPSQQYLIGPELYPLFRRGLRVAMVAIVLLSAVGFCVSLLLGGLAGYRAGGLLVQTLAYAFMAALVVVAVLVAAFAWMQRAELTLPRGLWPAESAWDARSLPPSYKADRAPRFEAVVGLVSAAAALVIVGVVGKVASEAGPHASTVLQPLIRDAVSGNVMLIQVALAVAALAHAVALVQGRWQAWTRGMRLVADSIAVFVFVPLPFRLLEHRSALLDSGITRNVVNWLVANALIFAAVLVGSVAFYWWRTWRRARAQGAGPSLSTALSLASTALLLAPLSACVIAPRITNTAITASAAECREIVSPEVSGDGRVTFRYCAPEASRVGLVREGKEPVPMTMGAGGVWSHTSDPLTPELYAYLFLIDGEPNHDPRNPIGVPMVTGGRWSLAHVPGPDYLPWEFSGAPAGELQRLEYRSARFSETREVWVYTPPGYDERGTRRYPVLYLLHGVLEDARAWSTAGRANVILDNMLAAGTAEPMIVAMPLGYGLPDASSRAGEMLSPATNQHVVMEEFAAGLLDEVLPVVESEYRTRPDPASRAIAGLSMGGTQALYIGLNHPETFGIVASFGAALVLSGGRYPQWFPRIRAADPNMPQFLSISVGTEDFLLGANRHFVDWLKSRGSIAQLCEVPGGHTWQVWRRELIRLAPSLFRDRRLTTQLNQEIR